MNYLGGNGLSELVFFQNRSNNNTVNKIITPMNYGTDNIVQAQIVNPCSIIRPVFVLGTTNFSLANCNYVYWNDGQRYYFIDDIILSNRGTYEIHCRIDVLYTYRKYIRELNTIVERHEQKSLCNPYIVDNNVVARVDRKIEKMQIGSVGGNATGTHIALTVTGGS